MNFRDFNNFINRLYYQKEIQIKQLNLEQYSPKQFCLASLLILLYNSSFKNPAIQLIYQYIQIQGEIIKLLGSLQSKGQPADYLMQFRFQEFFNFCVKNGESNLSRSIKGIYPLVNTKQDFIFKFLPYHELGIIQNKILGNNNWKHAKKVLKTRYHKLKDKLSKPIKLSYCLLLCQENELKQYFTTQSEKLWVSLYLHYINQGLKVYQYRQDNYKFQYQLNFPFNQENQVSLYKSIISFIMSKRQAKTVQKLQYIINKIYQAYPQNNQYTSLIISVLYKASHILQFQTILPKEFIWVPNQFYNRIFLNDQQIKIIYDQNRLNYIPNYDYGPQLMSFICQTCLRKNPQVIDQRSLSYINIKTRLYLLMNSPLLGHQNGQNVLRIVDKNKDLYINQLERISGNRHQITKIYQDFLGLWNNYYHLKHYPNQQSSIIQLLIYTPKQYLQDIKLSYPTDFYRQLNIIFNLYLQNLPIYGQQLSSIATTQRFRQLLGKLDKNTRDQIWSFWSQVEMNKVYISFDCIKSQRPCRKTIKTNKNQPQKIPQSYQIIQE